MFRHANLMLAVAADPEGCKARLAELEMRKNAAAARENAASAAEARAAKAQAKLEAEKAAHAEKAKAEWKLIGDTKAWAEHEKSEWVKDNAEIVEKARRWDRYSEVERGGIDLTNPAHMRDLHSGRYAHQGQLEEAKGTRRSAADLHAERLVAATPEVQFPAGTSISRSGRRGRA